MYYEVYHVYELMESAGISPSNVKEVSAVWGEGEDGNWAGGCCLESTDGTFLVLQRTDAGSVYMDESIDGPFTPPNDDFEIYPGDIRRWLDDGASVEDVYEY